MSVFKCQGVYQDIFEDNCNHFGDMLFVWNIFCADCLVLREDCAESGSGDPSCSLVSVGFLQVLRFSLTFRKLKINIAMCNFLFPLGVCVCMMSCNGLTGHRIQGVFPPHAQCSRNKLKIHCHSEQYKIVSHRLAVLMKNVSADVNSKLELMFWCQLHNVLFSSLTSAS